MPVTRQMELDGYKHITENVLNLTNETCLALKQLGVDTISDLLNEPFDTINKLDYYPTTTDADGNATQAPTKKPIARGSICLIMIFIDYCSYRYAKSDPITDWTTVTQDQFNKFRLLDNYIYAKKTPGKTQFTKDPNPVVIDEYYQVPQPPTVMNANGPVTRPPPTVPQPNYCTPNLQDQFMKGIKRDPSLFPTLKDEKFHDSWHRSFKNQMHVQGLHQVIDPTYNPTTPDEQAVFGLMQTFTYAVLDVGVVAGLVKVANSKGQTDRLARILWLRGH